MKKKKKLTSLINQLLFSFHFFFFLWQQCEFANKGTYINLTELQTYQKN